MNRIYHEHLRRSYMGENFVVSITSKNPFKICIGNLSESAEKKVYDDIIIYVWKAVKPIPLHLAYVYITSEYYVDIDIKYKKHKHKKHNNITDWTGEFGGEILHLFKPKWEDLKENTNKSEQKIKLLEDKLIELNKTLYEEINNAKIENRKNIDLEKSYCRTYMEHCEANNKGKCVRCGNSVSKTVIC